MQENMCVMVIILSSSMTTLPCPIEWPKAPQNNSNDTVAMGVAANLGAKHGQNTAGRVMEITYVPSQHLFISKHHQAMAVMFGLSLNLC